ncbi:glutamate synthase subunit beta [Cellulomonas sp. DKR-3]|uniref:Glutamate synthase subunit beta n=1 Tax=Cellulomonas fulva TaxID=2835530 RepID=A0ABS5U2E9_9CELL|nr:glutamate synthase subunit beta [Cellulomonas fulva]MBT0995573.1 glutamate synthase subunit beta [Cellulomonas fulva]
MADPRGFLRTRQRELPPDRAVAVRILDWDEVHRHPTGDVDQLAVLHRQAGRCMDCGVPFCHHACPLGNLVPEWNDLTWRGQWPDAVARLHQTNNFPELTGRLCPAPCESACVLGIGAQPVTIRNVELSLAEEAFDRGLVVPLPPERMTGCTVGVVGSGPAGLAAAQQLTQAGHVVCVYERDDAPGGLLRYGIPEYKLPAAVLERRLDVMRAEGTVFRCGIEVGRDVTVDELRSRHDALVVTTGATLPRPLPVPGAALTGVLPAMAYLVPANHAAQGRPVRGAVVATGCDVVVIGGGDTGADCVGTAVRQGARSITQLEILPEPPRTRPADQPWPVFPALFKVSSSHEEGGTRAFAVSTTEIVGDDEGRVAGVRVVGVERAADGALLPVAGTERVLPAQLVVLALGFTGPEPALPAALGLPLGERGAILRADDYSTAVDGVFVAGDCGRGQSLVVWAIAEGRSAAAAVDRYLTSSTALPSPVRPSTHPLQA